MANEMDKRSMSLNNIARGFRVENNFPWPIIKSEKIFNLKYGKSLIEPSRKKGKIPVYGSNGRCGWHDKSLQKGPGVILGRKGQGPLGVEWCPSDFWVIDTAYYLVLITEKVDLKYAYYLIKFVGLNHLKDGTSNPSLSRDTFKSQYFPIPPIEKQRSIVRIICTIDDKIELNRQMNETLEALARAIFKSWFVDFDPVRVKAEGRDTWLPQEITTRFPNGFEEIEGREVPKGWGVVKLGELASLDKGVSYKGEFLSDEGISMINLGCFTGEGKFSIDNLKFYKGEYRDRHVVKPGDIVLANTDITQKREVLGSPAIVPPFSQFNHCIFTHHVYAIRFKKEFETLNYVVYFSLLNPDFRERAIGFATGTTVLALPKDTLLEYSLVIPDEKIIQKFNDAIKPIFSMIYNNLEQSRTLAQIRDALLPKLMSGEIRV